MSFDSCLRLAQFSADSHEKRRAYEWKVSLGFWGAITLAILKKTDVPIHVGVWEALVVVFIYAFVWLRGLSVANENDKALSDFFRAEAVECLKDPTHRVGNPPAKIANWSWAYWFGFLARWAMLFQLVVSAALVYLFVRS